jgi:Kef-type K+ transport system membrane component KefB
MELTFARTGVLLLLIAAVVAMVARRLRLPYSVGLVVAGMALRSSRSRLTLPPLIFSSRALSALVGVAG